jgi:hypothetical protein
MTQTVRWGTASQDTGAGVGLMRTSRSTLAGVAATLAAATVLTSVLLTSPAMAAADTSAGPDASTSAPMVWGATVKNTGKQTPLQAVQVFQGKVGRNLAATRDFLSWDSPFPTAYENGLQAQGTTILLSVASSRLNKVKIPWTQVAAAQPGDALYNDMVSWADRVRDFGTPIYVTYQHEPEAAANKSLGSQADYIAAWRNWVSVFRAEGATNVRFMFITTAFGYTVKTTDPRYAPKWYPGDDVVDEIAVDAYNWFTCRATVKNSWNSLAMLIENQRQFGLLHPDKPLWLAEFASVEDPAVPDRRAQWLNDADALFQQPGYEQYQGVLYFNLKKQCDWRVETVPGALAAFSAMGADPFYSG